MEMLKNYLAQKIQANHTEDKVDANMSQAQDTSPGALLASAPYAPTERLVPGLLEQEQTSSLHPIVKAIVSIVIPGLVGCWLSWLAGYLYCLHQEFWMRTSHASQEESSPLEDSEDDK